MEDRNRTFSVRNDVSAEDNFPANPIKRNLNSVASAEDGQVCFVGVDQDGSVVLQVPVSVSHRF